jgi:feruloyl esterase
MRSIASAVLVATFAMTGLPGWITAEQAPSPAAPLSPLPDLGTRRTITEADCSPARLGSTIAPSRIGEPVSGVTLSAPQWVAPGETLPAHCTVDGAILPVDPRGGAKPINFRVVFPATWNRRAVQLGGGGMNGVIPALTGGRGAAVTPALGVVTYGSDSGHQGGRGAVPDWALNDEAIRNLGYMQMKKTRDAALVLIERIYGERPRFTYYVGTSQGGREALTVAQRYPDDYDGVISNVPIVSFSSLMLAPELIRIQEKPLASWVTRAKTNAIATEFVRQCDTLDGLADGIINNYLACRAIFDVKQAPAGRRPWAGKRCANNVDPNPADTSSAACLTDGQIATLEFVYSRYPFPAPLAHGVRSFGMWLPNTDPSGSGLIADSRFRGQEGAAADAPMHSHLGVLGVTGFLMRDLSANPLDYAEDGRFQERRTQLSEWLDSTNPDLSRFAKRGGRMIVTIGTDDTLASPGAQLDYYQSLIDTMGRAQVDRFARLFVIPQASHGLSGRNHATDGNGRALEVAPIPSAFDRLRVLVDWVERDLVPPPSLVVTAGAKSLPLCSYPAFPKYVAGPPGSVASYTCAAR